MRVLLRLLLLGLVMMTIGQPRAAAEPAAPSDKVKVAKQYVEAGLAAQGSGDYDTAITLYAKAYELVPHPLLIFNMAQAHRLAGHIEKALALYAKYLAEDPKGAQARTARELVAELEARKAAASEAKESDDEPISDEPADGTLVVTAQSEGGDAIRQGTVMVDEEPQGKLAGGTLTVTGLAEGRHTVAIEAGGYRRFEQTVTVHDGEQASLDARLHERPAPSSPPSRTVWQVSLAASLAVAAGGVGYSVYSYSRQNADLEQGKLQIMGENLASVGSGDCGKTYEAILADSNPRVTAFNYAALQSACKWSTQISIGFIVSTVGVVGAITSLILLTRDREPANTSAARATKPAIVPIITPGGGGAAFSLTW